MANKCPDCGLQLYHTDERELVCIDCENVRFPDELVQMPGQVIQNLNNQLTQAKAEIVRLKTELKRFQNEVEDSYKFHAGIGAALGPYCHTGEPYSDQIRNLKAIVDGLPKCWRLNDAGELVQDAPVTPGMIVYHIFGEGIQQSTKEARYCQDWRPDSSKGEHVHLAVFGIGFGVGVPVSDCYSTREAAQAAKEKDSE